MTKEQIERNREFLKDLRANPLKAVGTMRNSEESRCCLCVAMDTAVRLGMPLSEQEEEEATMVPPQCVADFYGWPDFNPTIGSGNNINSAARWNDMGEGITYSHCKIAEKFEETWPELKTQEA
jgi:hypothetical protein